LLSTPPLLLVFLTQGFFRFERGPSIVPKPKAASLSHEETNTEGILRDFKGKEKGKEREQEKSRFKKHASVKTAPVVEERVRFHPLAISLIR